MSSQTPEYACDLLKTLYAELTEEVNDYARRDHAKPGVVDRKHKQLQLLYDVFITFEPLCSNLLMYMVLCQATQMLAHDSSLSGIRIMLRTRTEGINFGFLEYNLHDSTSH